MDTHVGHAHPERRLSAGLATLAFLLVPGCNDPAAPGAHAIHTTTPQESCEAAPLEAFDAYDAGALGSTGARFDARVSAIGDPDAFGQTAIVLRNADGTEHRLVLRLGGDAAPIQPGAEYTFDLQHIGGSPPASALVVRDAEGLVFAGATDQTLGAHVLAQGIPGFALALLDPTCASRPHDDCVEALFNLPLQVTTGGASATLYNGQSAELGGYTVRCRVAQSARYSGRCPDYGLPGVSYTIARNPPVR